MATDRRVACLRDIDLCENVTANILTQRSWRKPIMNAGVESGHGKHPAELAGAPTRTKSEGQPKADTEGLHVFVPWSCSPTLSLILAPALLRKDTRWRDGYPSPCVMASPRSSERVFVAAPVADLGFRGADRCRHIAKKANNKCLVVWPTLTQGVAP